MVLNETEQQEREYLRQVTDAVKEAISAADVSVTGHVETLKEQKDYLWSNKDLDPQEIRSMRESILNHFALGENVIARRKRLGRLLDNPYFGRIDFRDDRPGSETEPLYIGLQTFRDLKNKANLIHDWRAPVSGMFYDYETGQASYATPTGNVTGQIFLKRQYRIRNGEMKYMIENSLTVHDEILQKELSAATGHKMKNIVATIQREQNRVIRDEEASTLIIQGVAGSGKTSIAMHRVAYLLYRFKGGISASDILVLSPNKIFASYISNVLPELGEEVLPETNMEQVLSNVLGNRFRYQSFFEQVAALLAKPQAEFAERIRYKASFAFISQLDAFLLHIENNFFRAADVKLTGHLIIPAEFIEAQFRRFNRLPIRMRFGAMADYILEMAQVQYRIAVTTDNRNMLREAIRAMFAGNNDLQVYKDFFAWAGKPEMFKLMKNRTLEYADLAPLAYVHLALEGTASQNRVKHLLIDEMQDYSPIQYKLIQKLYPCRKTILGDAGQSLNPYSCSDAEMIRKAFGSAEIMRLNKSYRSTYEIAQLARVIRPGSDMEIIERHGAEVRICRYETSEDEINAIAGFLSGFKKSGFNSLGIICKEEAEASALYEQLKPGHPDLHFLSHQSTAWINGIVVISVHMAKGLEFDEVIIPHAGRKNYKTEIDRSMLYIAVTRAMHRLSLTGSGEITGFLTQATTQ